LLVLTRKEGEALLIEGGIEIRVLEVKGRQVKLGLIAPEEVRIFRKELYERIKEENLRAARVPETLNEILIREEEK